VLDFLRIETRSGSRGTIEVYPNFRLCKSTDLMIRGGDFYAIWVEDRGLWSTDEQDAIDLIDRELDRYVAANKDRFDGFVKVLYMWDSKSGIIDDWHHYCKRQMRDNYVMLDEKLIFANTETTKQDYASKRLNYPLEAGSIAAYDKLISTLYSEEERLKIEWAIGSIISGDSKKIQKFMVLYGPAGSGKSTILNIVQKLFKGYYSVFDAKALGSASNSFALEAFKSNPLVAIQHDGDLSKIEDNTRLNSLVSHELMTVNEKFKSTYANDFKCFLFMGTNRPVKITDAKSGLIRRLIDVTPSGNKLHPREYMQIMDQVAFELGAIAYHCQEVYLSDPGRYDDYIPVAMFGASNDFYNFIIDSYYVFKKEDGTTLSAAWAMYNEYCESAKVPYPLSQRAFGEELKNYFRDYDQQFSLEDGSKIRRYYRGFRTEKFERPKQAPKAEPKTQSWLQFGDHQSIFDSECSECIAQYASAQETPSKAWDYVTTKLSDLDTSKLHFVLLPEAHIVIDFDLKDKDGKKSLEKNLEAACKWPPTYAELSKSGAGIHLHYIYTGDPSKLSRIFEPGIEIKVFTGKSSLRRRLTKCNDIPIATISSGLPLKGDDRMVNFEALKSEKAIRTLIARNLGKEIHPGTKPSIDFIYKILEDAYNSDLKYDVSDMYGAVLAFAANSTHQADYCVKLVNKMQFKSAEISDSKDPEDDSLLVFFDIEVFPNLFLVNWKFKGEGKPVVRMINPGPSEIEDILSFNLVGFNNRDYDNHMLYAAYLGYDNEQLYKLSQRLVNKNKAAQRAAKIGEAFNLSYTDVFDFATKKQSLKKWEIELGIHHQELGLPWDKPVPKERWVEVAEYCDNDVIATEAVFNKCQGDFIARKIQVDLVKLMHGITNVSVNDTTNALSGKIIFGKNTKPQSQFNWRNLAEPVGSDRYEEYREKFGPDYKFRVFNADGLPEYRDYIPGEVLPEGWSILPFFKGYEFKNGKSTYLGYEIGEGGRVFATPGMYGPTWDGDVASMHPHSIIFECLFGPVFTKVFEEVVHARVAVKHKDFEAAGRLLGGALKPYLTEELAADLAQALKIVINSIYGLTSAAFPNLFRDPSNIDNIVAKRGALFMTLLTHEVQKRGFTVAHIKTDSIKIPNASEKIIQFVTDFGKEYGYTFETEANFDRFALVNDAVYIAKYSEPIIDKKTGKEIWWTATGKQFAVPYVFKTLFSKETVEFDDLCETFSCNTALYLDRNEHLQNSETVIYEKELEIRKGNIALERNGKKPKRTNPDLAGMSMEELEEACAAFHNRLFVGKVGRFCPIKPGLGGGELLRESISDDGTVKYAAPSGTKGRRWLESEMIETLGKESEIDLSYFNDLVNDAIDTLSQYGDFDHFVSDAPYINFPLDEDVLPWYTDDELNDLFSKR
jgi:energy-coupling factor transporter ATP-binding protein EcfA2